MFSWVVVEAEHGKLLPPALALAWGSGAEVARVALPARKALRELLFVAAPPGQRPLRAPRWPDVLTDWHDIYGDALFPDDALPVLAEALSSLGADALALHADHGLAGATVAWYAKGALSLYEHVGGSTVAWNEEDGLGRPPDGTFTGAVTSFVLDRIALQNRATGEALLVRALHRFLAADPPPFDDLAGRVATAPRASIDAQA
ncbi:MAG TPA: hypothetical protein VMZ28_05745 [Kofleriaceae bacterium]|nr:hypothetical protein [Kofleriaceae bacterium]